MIASLSSGSLMGRCLPFLSSAIVQELPGHIRHPEERHQPLINEEVALVAHGSPEIAVGTTRPLPPSRPHPTCRTLERLDLFIRVRLLPTAGTDHGWGSGLGIGSGIGG